MAFAWLGGMAQGNAAVPAPALPGAAAASPPAHRADLLEPAASQDLSAYRYDSEVFGWNNDFSEVGCVVMEVARGPKGKHRGEAYMLVYRLGEWLPKHNIICHSITHVDLPHNPVPMEQARDYLWAIEYSFLQMWPQRPIRRKRPHFMDVTPITAFLPEAFKLPPTPHAAPKADAPGVPPLVALGRRDPGRPSEDAAVEPPCTSAPGPSGASEQDARCRPWVGFVLQWHGQRRLQPFVPLDVGARCAALHRGDAPRTYWGRADVAASMVQIDFAARPQNEESARFLSSAAWRLATTPTLDVQGAVITAAQAKALARAVTDMGGRLRWRPGAGAPGPLRVRGGEQWLAWGAVLAEHLHIPVARYVVDPSQAQGLVWERAAAGDDEAAATFAGAKVQPVQPVQPVPAAPTSPAPMPLQDASPAALPATSPMPPEPASPPKAPAPPKARYLDDWKP